MKDGVRDDVRANERDGEGRELDSLRAAWDGLDAPPPHAIDGKTRAAVAWLRGAWRAVEAPAPPAPPALPASIRKPLRDPRRDPLREPLSEPLREPRLWPLTLAAAAGWILALVLIVPRAGGPRDPGIAGLPPALAPQREPRPVHARFREDGSVVLRSGKVKLVLVDGPPSATETRETGGKR